MVDIGGTEGGGEGGVVLLEPAADVVAEVAFIGVAGGARGEALGAGELVEGVGAAADDAGDHGVIGPVAGGVGPQGVERGEGGEC